MSENELEYIPSLLQKRKLEN